MSVSDLAVSIRLLEAAQARETLKKMARALNELERGHDPSDVLDNLEVDFGASPPIIQKLRAGLARALKAGHRTDFLASTWEDYIDNKVQELKDREVDVFSPRSGHSTRANPPSQDEIEEFREDEAVKLAKTLRTIFKKL